MVGFFSGAMKHILDLLVVLMWHVQKKGVQSVMLIYSQWI